ncbi:hypothetical protein PCE1_000118 [Barthelona sp. PCE]
MATTEICNFSGRKCYPGTGTELIKIDERTVKFQTKKARSLHTQGYNPRRMGFTGLYRIDHPKGDSNKRLKHKVRMSLKKSRRVFAGADAKIILQKTKAQTAKPMGEYKRVSKKKQH